MKLAARLSVIVLLGLVTWVSSAAFAQGNGMGKHPGMPAFSEFDIDGNGVIAEDEFYKARAERIAKHAAEGRKMKNLENAPTFADIDSDSDGGVSSEEFNAHQAERRAKMRQAK